MEQDQEANNSFYSNSSISQSSGSDESNEMIINPETNEIEGINQEVDDADYTPIVFNKHLNTNEEKIICIELKNNNKLYIEYQENWTIKEVNKSINFKLINKIIQTKQFSNLYSNNIQFILDTDYLHGLFDLNLAVYRNIKSELETKLDYTIQLGYLKKQGLLSNYRYPFLIFNDCKSKTPFNQTKEILEKILQDYDKNCELSLNLYYNSFLPRTNTVSFLGKSPVKFGFN